MNKTELIAAVAAKANVSKKDAEGVINATLDTIGDALANKKDGKVTLIGFGTFESKKREAREGRNPRTGSTVEIEAAVFPVFKAGKAFKDKVNG